MALIQEQQIRLCKCGCGKEANPGRRFIYGHNGKKDFLPLRKAGRLLEG